MLNDEQKALLRAEEEFRAEVREELQSRRARASSKRRFWEFLNSPVGGWLLGTVVVGLAGFGWTRYYEWRTTEAREQAARRQNAQEEVQLVTAMLPQLGNIGSPECLMAAQIIHHLRKTNALDVDLAGGLDAILENVANESYSRSQTAGVAPAEKANYLQTAEAAVAALVPAAPKSEAAQPTEATPTEAPAAPSAATGAAVNDTRLPPRVFIQIANEEQRRAARILAEQLRSQSLLVPGIENVGAKAPAAPEVRYFNDEDRAVAEVTQKSLSEQGLSATKLARVQMRASRGTVEVWFGR